MLVPRRVRFNQVFGPTAKSSDLRSNDRSVFGAASWLKRAKAMSAALWITKPKGGGKGRKIAETCVKQTATKKQEMKHENVFFLISAWKLYIIYEHVSKNK